MSCHASGLVLVDFLQYFPISHDALGGLDGRERHATDAMQVDVLPREQEVAHLRGDGHLGG